MFVSTTITGGRQETLDHHGNRGQIRVERGPRALLTSGDCCDVLDVPVNELRTAGIKLHRGHQFEFGSQVTLDGLPQGVDFVPSVGL